jgi:hypothetical protein
VLDECLSRHTGLAETTEKAQESGIFRLLEHLAFSSGAREQQAGHGFAVHVVQQAHQQLPARRAEQRADGVDFRRQSV